MLPTSGRGCFLTARRPLWSSRRLPPTGRRAASAPRARAPLRSYWKNLHRTRQHQRRVSSASAARNSDIRGGFPSTLSTCCGRPLSLFSRCPQPVRRMTGVSPARDLTAAATARPSTLGMPRSEMTADVHRHAGKEWALTGFGDKAAREGTPPRAPDSSLQVLLARETMWSTLPDQPPSNSSPRLRLRYRHLQAQQARQMNPQLRQRASPGPRIRIFQRANASARPPTTRTNFLASQWRTALQ